MNSTGRSVCLENVDAIRSPESVPERVFGERGEYLLLKRSCCRAIGGDGPRDVQIGSFEGEHAPLQCATGVAAVDFADAVVQPLRVCECAVEDDLAEAACEGFATCVDR